MVTTKVKEGSDYRYEEGVQYPGRLISVEEREIKFNYKADSAVVKAGKARVGEAGSFKRWTWTFKFTSGEHEGDTITADTEPGITTRSNDQARQFAETLLGREMGIAEDFDSDAITGLPCLFTVFNQEPAQKKDGTMGFYSRVADVFPVGTGEGNQDGSQNFDDPPF